MCKADKKGYESYIDCSISLPSMASMMSKMLWNLIVEDKFVKFNPIFMN